MIRTVVLQYHKVLVQFACESLIKMNVFSHFSYSVWIDAQQTDTKYLRGSKLTTYFPSSAKKKKQF